MYCSCVVTAVDMSLICAISGKSQVTVELGVLMPSLVEFHSSDDSPE